VVDVVQFWQVGCVVSRSVAIVAMLINLFDDNGSVYLDCVLIAGKFSRTIVAWARQSEYA